MGNEEVFGMFGGLKCFGGKNVNTRSAAQIASPGGYTTTRTAMFGSA